MNNKILEQILTNQLCIMATLTTLELHPIQYDNLRKRIKETKEIRDEMEE